jgi:hypothetical protein
VGHHWDTDWDTEVQDRDTQSLLAGPVFIGPPLGAGSAILFLRAVRT